MSKTALKPALHTSQPQLYQSSQEIQAFGTVRLFPIGLPHDTRLYSCQRLNQLLAEHLVNGPLIRTD